MSDIDPRKLRASYLLNTGHKPSQVAEELGISLRTLQRWQKEPDFQSIKQSVVVEATNATVAATVEQISNISNTTYAVLSYEQRKNLIWEEYGYLQKATQAILSRVEQGDLRAISVLIKLSQRRCELLSLNMPKNDLLNAVMICTQFGLLSDQQSDTFVNRISNFFEGGVIDGNYEQSENFEED